MIICVCHNFCEARFFEKLKYVVDIVFKLDFVKITDQDGGSYAGQIIKVRLTDKPAETTYIRRHVFRAHWSSSVRRNREMTPETDVQLA